MSRTDDRAQAHSIQTTSTEQPSQRPQSNDRSLWAAYWAAHGQPWRTEPEIPVDRQEHLSTRRALPDDIILGVFPFKDIETPLTRADIEWLLATHEDGRGPVDWGDGAQRGRQGIDLRGADLHGVDLSNLPLSAMRSSTPWTERADLTEAQHVQAALNLEAADLKGAHLEGASLEYANLHAADLRGAVLDNAILDGAILDGAFLAQASMVGASLWLAHLDDAFLWETNLVGAVLREAHFDGAHMERAILADARGVGPQMVDARWGDANIGVIEWSQVRMVAEEERALRMISLEQMTAVDRLAIIKGQQNVRPDDVQLALFDEAVRANRQLALVLRDQGLNEDADRFAYRAQVLQRRVFLRQRRYGQYLFSSFLDGIAGYGFRIQRIAFTYLAALTLFALLYFVVGQTSGHPMSVGAAIITSVTAFHGRVFASSFAPGDPLSWVTAAEALVGVVVEGVFIAMLTQRFFGR